MISVLAAKAAEEVPKLYESGWEWWAWITAWIALVLVGLLLAGAAPLVAGASVELEGSSWRTPALIGSVLLVGAGVVAGLVGPRVLMRHMDSGAGAFWVFLGCLFIGAACWVWAAWFLPDLGRGGWAGWVHAAPLAVIGAGSVFGGIAELFTRVAASIPMPVGQLGALLILGVVGFGAYTVSQRR